MQNILEHRQSELNKNVIVNRNYLLWKIFVAGHQYMAVSMRGNLKRIYKCSIYNILIFSIFNKWTKLLSTVRHFCTLQWFWLSYPYILWIPYLLTICHVYDDVLCLWLIWETWQFFSFVCSSVLLCHHVVYFPVNRYLVHKKIVMTHENYFIPTCTS